jgi:hypothetical protein
MGSEKIEIGTPGIKKTLRRYNLNSAIAEFVWNGFDAEARVVEIKFEANELGGIKYLWIYDDGQGIQRNLLNQKFKPFLQTSRAVDPQAKYDGPSAIHGKNGYGRLTFFHFAYESVWFTTYKTEDGRCRSYSITIREDNLNTYLPTEEQNVESSETGTKVRFAVKDLIVDDINDISRYLAREFAWYLELGSPFPREIRIDGTPLRYKELIGDQAESKIPIGEIVFSIRYIRWNESLNDRYSRYYFSDSNRRERRKQNTSFNNKGDNFFHSIFVQSAFFDDLEEEAINIGEKDSENGQLSLDVNDRERNNILRDLVSQLEGFLKKKRSPFLRKRAKEYVDSLQADGIFPDFGLDRWDQYRKQELTEVMRELYEADPRIFSNLNRPQKQTLVRLFNLIIDSSERDHLLDVIAEVVNLTKEERMDFANILKSARLSNIITTIKLIQDRYTAVDELKKLIYHADYQANERDHLQTHIERHFWLFGEKYHLVTAAEPDFEAALRRHTYVLYGETANRKINHPDKNKEMDIFAVRQMRDLRATEVNNIVAELKHPHITIGQKEFQQVKTYMEVLLEQPEFNGSNMTWEFYLVGNDYDKSIAREIENVKNHGEQHLAYKVDNWKIYVMRWSEIINNFSLRHDFILDKLKLERAKLATQAKSADEIIANGHHNSAALSVATKPIISDAVIEPVT